MSADPAAPARAAPVVAPPEVTPAVVVPAVPKPALTKAAPAPLGFDQLGKTVLASFQPSASSLALLLTPYLKNSLDLKGVLPLPDGLDLVRSPGGCQIQLRVAPLFATRMRRTLNYLLALIFSKHFPPRLRS